MKWISVKDRLPAEETPVLVWVVYDVGVCVCQLSKATYIKAGAPIQVPAWFPSSDLEVVAFALNDITHWMPLPEPPVVEALAGKEAK